MQLFTNKVLLGIVLTFVIGGLTAVSAISPQWGGAITLIVGLLTAVGHTTNVIKGV